MILPLSSKKSSKCSSNPGKTFCASSIAPCTCDFLTSSKNCCACRAKEICGFSRICGNSLCRNSKTWRSSPFFRSSRITAKKSLRNRENIKKIHGLGPFVAFSAKHSRGIPAETRFPATLPRICAPLRRRRR